MPINKTILTSPKYGRYTRPSIIKLGPAETVEPYAISTKYFRFCQILSQKPPAAGVDSGVTKKARKNLYSASRDYREPVADQVRRNANGQTTHPGDQRGPTGLNLTAFCNRDQRAATGARKDI